MVRRNAGFTLLELLVALSIFAAVWVMALSGWYSVTRTDRWVAESAEQLRHLQWSLLMLTRDISTAATRSVRDEYGDSRPALHADSRSGSSAVLELTIASWQNPAGLKRSNLQRVSWGVSDGLLLRTGWPVLDRAQDSPPYQAVMADRIRSLGLRFLDADDKWHKNWPPEAESDTDFSSMPRAVEIVLDVEGVGEVRRLVPTISAHQKT